MCAGDLLAKNAFVALGCVVKGQYLRAPARLAAGAVIATADTPGRLHPAEGGVVDDAMQSAQGGHARRALSDLPAPRLMPTPPAPRPSRHAPPPPHPPTPPRPALCSTRCSPAELIFDSAQP